VKFNHDNTRVKIDFEQVSDFIKFDVYVK